MGARAAQRRDASPSGQDTAYAVVYLCLGLPDSLDIFFDCLEPRRPKFDLRRLVLGEVHMRSLVLDHSMANVALIPISVDIHARRDLEVRHIVIDNLLELCAESERPGAGRMLSLRYVRHVRALTG